MMNNSSKTKVILNSSGSNITSPSTRFTDSYFFWLLLLITVVVFAVLVKLGFWQMSRGEEKLRLEEIMEARAMQDYVPLSSVFSLNEHSDITGIKVTVSVKPDRNQLFLLDNQTYQRKVGYLGYQLAKIEPSDLFQNEHWIAIELGFIAGLRSRADLPAVISLPEEMIELSGRLYAPSSNPLSHQLLLENSTPYRIQNWNFLQLSAYTELDVVPFILQPTQSQGAEKWPYPQPWTPLPMGSQKHFGYAVQWFSMAGVFLFLCLWIWIKRARH